MQAVWHEAFGDAEKVLKTGTIDTPVPGHDEVLVSVKASGVNPSDVKTRSGARGQMMFPFVVPHSDGAGIIHSVGDGVDPARVGQRVWIWNGAWQRQFGTCAEYIAVPAVQAVPLPANTDFASGACLGVPASTACHALFSHGEISDQTILVAGGAGSVGHYAIQLAKWAGARVIATVSSEEKAQVAREAGADFVINYREPHAAEAVLDAAGGQVVDRVVEVEFGGNLALSNKVLKSGGVIVAYGSMADPAPSIPFYEMMFNNTTVQMMLVYLLSSQERAAVNDRLSRALSDGALIHNIACRFPFTDAVLAHQTVESGSVIGNVVIDISATGD